jgi:hypothetical protein
MRGEGVAGSMSMSTAVYNVHGAQINFGDITAYLICGSFSPLNGVLHSLVKHMICLFGCKEKVKNESFCGTVLLF